MNFEKRKELKNAVDRRKTKLKRQRLKRIREEDNKREAARIRKLESRRKRDQQARRDL